MDKRIDEAALKPLPASAIQDAFEETFGVFTTLVKEHAEISALMRHVSKTANAKTRAQLYPGIRQRLLEHERGELAEVYPALSQYAQTEHIAAHHRESVGELESAIHALNRLDFAAPSWGPAFERLVRLVQHHRMLEEDDYFPRAQQVIGADEADALDRRYGAAKTGRA
jgi:Hemerythrin HHE cation binding domain